MANADPRRMNVSPPTPKQAHATQLAAARHAAELREIAAARAADEKAYKAMPVEQQREYSSYLTRQQAAAQEEGVVVLGPAGWQVQQDLAANGRPTWETEGEWREYVNSPAALAGIRTKMGQLEKELADMEKQWDALDNDRATRGLAATRTLRKSIDDGRRTLEHTRGLHVEDQYQLLFPETERGAATAEANAAISGFIDAASSGR